jgi:hypothetical protein
LGFQPRQKQVSEAPISTNKRGIMEGTGNPSFVGCTYRRIVLLGQPRQKVRHYPKNNIKAKRDRNVAQVVKRLLA